MSKIKSAEDWLGVHENPFVVPTPHPYVLPAETDDETKERLLISCQVLWRVLFLLKISPFEAYQKKFSLNEHTFEELYHTALQQGRYSVSRYLRRYGWSSRYRSKPRKAKVS